MVLEILQQLLDAAQGGTAAVGLDGHQHDRFPRPHPSHPVGHQHRAHPVARRAGLGEGSQLGLGHAGVVLQFEGLEGRAGGGGGAHAADEVAFGGGNRGVGLLCSQASLPGRQPLQRLEGGLQELHRDRRGWAPGAGGRHGSASGDRGQEGHLVAG